MFGKTLWRAASVGTIRRARPGVVLALEWRRRHEPRRQPQLQEQLQEQQQLNPQLSSYDRRLGVTRSPNRLNLLSESAAEVKDAVAFTVIMERMTKLAGLIPGTLVFPPVCHRRLVMIDGNCEVRLVSMHQFCTELLSQVASDEGESMLSMSMHQFCTELLSQVASDEGESGVSR